MEQRHALPGGQLPLQPRGSLHGHQTVGSGLMTRPLHEQTTDGSRAMYTGAYRVGCCTHTRHSPMLCRPVMSHSTVSKRTQSGSLATVPRNVEVTEAEGEQRGCC